MFSCHIISYWLASYFLQKPCVSADLSDWPSTTLFTRRIGWLLYRRNDWLSLIQKMMTLADWRCCYWCVELSVQRRRLFGSVRRLSVHVDQPLPNTGSLVRSFCVLVRSSQPHQQVYYQLQSKHGDDRRHHQSDCIRHRADPVYIPVVMDSYILGYML